MTEIIKGTGRPAAGYKNSAGQKVPGCTTIVSRFKESGALLYWAWQVGLRGEDMNKAKEAAADAGSCAHEMIDCHLHDRVFKIGPWDAMTIAKAEHAFHAFLEWKEQNNLTLLAAELSLVSEKHQFGGTFDAIMAGGTLRILDYKTSNGIYQDYLIQVAGGYSLLWKEHMPDQPLHGMDLLRVSKPKEPTDPVSFHHHHWSAEIFPLAERQFLLFREAFDLDKRLKGLL